MGPCALGADKKPLVARLANCEYVSCGSRTKEQLLGLVFLMSRIIKVEVECYQPLAED